MHIHIFKVSDGRWIYSGTKIPSNLATDEYVQGFLPQGEEWDQNYEYTCVNGVAVKGDAIEFVDPPED